MKLARLLTAMLLAALVVPSSAVAAARRGVAARNWVATGSVAPGGGFVLGNPRAPVRLIEYSSFTCSHCAQFAGEGWPELMSYVRSGRLALEVRPAVRDRFDVVATMLARCQGPARYFDLSKELFARQAEWLGKAASWEQGGEPKLDTLAPADALQALARAAGLDTILGPRGYTPAVIRACLADPKVQQPIEASSEEAWQQRKISGTPAFLINDVAIDVHGWAALKPFIEDAVK